MVKRAPLPAPVGGEIDRHLQLQGQGSGRRRGHGVAAEERRRDAFIGLLVGQQQNRLAAAQQREDAPGALMLADLLLEAFDRAGTGDETVDSRDCWAGDRRCRHPGRIRWAAMGMISQLAKWPDSSSTPLPRIVFGNIEILHRDAGIATRHVEFVEMGIFGGGASDIVGRLARRWLRVRRGFFRERRRRDWRAPCAPSPDDTAHAARSSRPPQDAASTPIRRKKPMNRKNGAASAP